MQMPLCSRCKKNVAVVFISQMNSDPSKNQGYCLKCARELGIGPINGLMQQMGLTDEDIVLMFILGARRIGKTLFFQYVMCRPDVLQHDGLQPVYAGRRRSGDRTVGGAGRGRR